MKKILILILAIVLGVLMVNSALAIPDAYGRAAADPKGDIEITNVRIVKTLPLSIALGLEIYGLETNYEQGSTLMVTCDERVEKVCIGNFNPKLVAEFYSGDKDHQTTTNYEGGERADFFSIDEDDLGSYILYNAIYNLPDNAKPGIWSISCYISCDDPARIISTVDEENFEVGEVCIPDNPESRTLCFGGNPYWYDNCGNRQQQVDVCGANTECIAGGCVPLCQYEKFSKKCDGNRLVWVDDCGRETSLIKTCDNKCENGACKDEPKVCEQVPTKPCTGATWNDYPYCEWDEVGCNVGCSTNEDCPPQYDCVNTKCVPGTDHGETPFTSYFLPGVLTIVGIYAGIQFTPFALIIAGIGIIWLILVIL